MNILIIAGGWSNERAVSLSAVPSICSALEKNGHSVTFFDLSLGFDNLTKIAKEHDFAFINLHGAPGEDGIVQAVLDAAQVPYQGSGARASLLALHKAATKQIYRMVNIPTPDWEFLPVRPHEDWETQLPLPLFVKSNVGGSSLLQFYVQQQSELQPALEKIFNAGHEVLIETSIAGKDATCGILGDEALPPVFIRPLAGTFFDYDSKYKEKGAEELCPAPFSPAVNARMQKLALKAHHALGLNGYSRTDFRITDDDEIFTLETNTLPGMTATSLIPQEALVAGYTFSELLEKLIELGTDSK